MLDSGADADLNVADEDGDTPIANADGQGHSAVVALLREHLGSKFLFLATPTILEKIAERDRLKAMLAELEAEEVPPIEQPTPPGSPPA